MWRERSAYRVLVGKSEVKRLFGRTGTTWKDNSKMDLKSDVIMGIGLMWLRVVTVGEL
jgi:hypothetical protein